ncbi:bifunctional isochorismate lyase/aryl carrier protein [Actinokineospora baliensis]|uniref:phosphopantetheine-binding protein n=1 Tax=Actinokineospora baliensis TaxID=547056 RepID=UPI00195A0137|nr:phosphopantetheine-binding protein [Actinokineospora baliensis]MBM7773082.1 bifunctional isochorismate lyase/aryl carrier protein [Actinokineospora baliensis]
MTPEELRAQVAALLEVPARTISFDDNLLDHGLDSIRVMTLVESWRTPTIAFADLAETPTITAWAALLNRQ